MSKLFLSMGLLTLASAMTGCAMHGPASHEELCNQLRSQLIYNSIDHNITATTTTDAQKQITIDKLKLNNCEPVGG